MRDNMEGFSESDATQVTEHHMPDWIEQLQARLREPLPGVAAHRTMAPTLAYGRHAGPPAASAKPAAVAVILTRDEQGQWTFPLTVRPQHMKDHAGQVCLPGGVVECLEDDWCCAMREAEEELRVPRSNLSMVGKLTPLYVFGTNFMMQPVVFVCRAQTRWDPNPAEVHSVLDVPLAKFLALGQAESIAMERDGVCFRSPAWPLSGYWVWGATAMVLAEWQQILRDVADTVGAERWR